jgi:tRNA-Thr(GGU) m(6)t(6)A37 methyltransferase TsaA
MSRFCQRVPFFPAPFFPDNIMTHRKERPGDIALPFDPAETASDAAVVFIGRIRSPWKTREDCPRNLAQARERGLTATVELDDVWRPGLKGLQAFSHAILLYWMGEARRDLIVQAPSHKPEPTGVFALRSPARPNPIALATVRILDIDQSAGRLTIDAIDCLDGTSLLDIKPWIETVDAVTAEG